MEWSAGKRVPMSFLRAASSMSLMQARLCARDETQDMAMTCQADKPQCVESPSAAGLPQPRLGRNKVMALVESSFQLVLDSPFSERGI